VFGFSSSTWENKTIELESKRLDFCWVEREFVERDERLKREEIFFIYLGRERQ